MGNKKLDDALGLTNGIEEFLSDLELEQEKNKLTDIDQKVKDNVNTIDQEIQKYDNNGIQAIDISNIQNSLCEIKELIDLSKDTIRKIYDNISDQEMIDSDLVHSLASLMETSHLQVKEYIDLYRDRVGFYDKVRLQALKHQQDMAKLERKHQMYLEKLNMKQASKTIDTTNNAEVVPFNQEEIIKQLCL